MFMFAVFRFPGFPRVVIDARLRLYFTHYLLRANGAAVPRAAPARHLLGLVHHRQRAQTQRDVVAHVVQPSQSLRAPFHEFGRRWRRRRHSRHPRGGPFTQDLNLRLGEREHPRVRRASLLLVRVHHLPREHLDFHDEPSAQPRRRRGGIRIFFGIRCILGSVLVLLGGRRQRRWAAQRERRAVLPGHAHDALPVTHGEDPHGLRHRLSIAFVDEQAADLDVESSASLVAQLDELWVRLEWNGFGRDVRDGLRQVGVLAVAEDVQRARGVVERPRRPVHLLPESVQPIRGVGEGHLVLPELPHHVPALDRDLCAAVLGRPLREDVQPRQPLAQVVEVARQLALPVRLGLPWEVRGEPSQVGVGRVHDALDELR